MFIPFYLIVLLSILSLFPVFAVGTWLFLRAESMRHDVSDASHKVDLMHADYKRIIDESAQFKSKIADVETGLKASDLRAVSFEESLRSCQNKIAVRERDAKREQRRTEEKPDREEESIDREELIKQHGLPMFGQEPAAIVPSPLKRQFGVLK